MRSCKQGTLLLTVTSGGTTRDANQLSIDVSIDNGAPETSTRSRAAGARGTIEIDFPNGYPVGKPVDVRVTALRDGSALATSMGSVQSLPAGCATLTVPLDDGATAGAGGGGGTGTGGSAGGRGGTGGSTGGRGGSVVVPNRNVDSCSWSTTRRRCGWRRRAWSATSRRS